MSTKIKKNSEGKKVYELAFLLKDSSEKVVFDFLAQHKAVILSQSPVNSMKLAYPIKKHLSGFFGVINLETEPENMKALSSSLNLSADVLRFLIIAVPNASAKGGSASGGKKYSEGSEPRRMSKTETAGSSSGSSSVLSNKALEEKLEEILK